jgi:hypothetical protein
MSKIIKIIDKVLALYEPSGVRHLWREVQKKATESTVEFITTKMPNALFCKNPLDVLEYSISKKEKGIVAEFGVFSGKTINHIASLLPEEIIYGFDSFEGLPEQWQGFLYMKNWFDKKGQMPSVKPNVKLIKGWFDNTVPSFFKEQNSPVSILHIDCDIYSSTKTVFDSAKPYFQKGSILIFDEFFNYPGYEKHEFKAFFELIDEIKMDFDFIAYSGNQVAVKLL